MLTGPWDVLRLAVLLACAPLLFLTAARAVIRRDRAQTAISVSTGMVIVGVAWDLGARLGRNVPPTAQLWLIAAAMPIGLWGGWRFYRHAVHTQRSTFPSRPRKWWLG